MHLEENAIEDISSLASHTSLVELDPSRNQVSDISALAPLAELQFLSLARNLISDISPLIENTGIGGQTPVLLTENILDLSEGSEDVAVIRELMRAGVRVIYQ